MLDDNLKETTQIAIGLPKKPKKENIKEMVNQYIKELKDEGTLDDMYDRWVYQGIEDIPYIDEAENPTSELIVGTTGLVPLYTFYKGEKLCGYDVELAERLEKNISDKVFYIDEGVIYEEGTPKELFKNLKKQKLKNL